MEDQVKDGGHAHWPWPRGIEPWKWRELRQAMSDVGLPTTELDGRMAGVRGPVNAG